MSTPRPGRRLAGQSSIQNDTSLPPSRYPKIDAKLELALVPALALELELELELAPEPELEHSTASPFMKQKILAFKQRDMKMSLRKHIINRLL